MPFKKWTDIDSLSHVMRSRNQSEWMQSQGPVLYRPKIKLHGTNAAVRMLPDGRILPQSRTQILGIQNDNFGFAAWLESNKPDFEVWRECIGPGTIYGEWAGPGIQKSVSVSQITKKTFFIFAAETEEGLFIANVEDYINFLSETIKVLPWARDGILVDFADAKSLADFADVVNEMVEETETCDPYIKAEYGIEGPGEGYVFYANPHKFDPGYKGFMFKAKGEAHRVNKTKSAATVDPEKLKSVAAFVAFSVTEPRLEQGFREAVNEVADPKLTGDFLRWIANDVIKECTPELVDNGLDWKAVASAVSKKASNWYINKTKVI